MDSSSSTYHQKRGHMFFSNTVCNDRLAQGMQLTPNLLLQAGV